MNTQGWTECVKNYLVGLGGGTTDPIETVDNGGSEGFVDGCDNYEGFGFAWFTKEGRLIYVTVEDVTAKDETG